MADREARIKFRAETAEFQSQIKAANSTMASLRSEMRLNEAQFKNSGDRMDYLKQKSSLLESQIAANRDKQTALNAELQIAASIYGQDSTQVAALEKQLNYVKAQEEQLKGQLSAVNGEISRNETATGQLTNKIEDQERELERLKQEYVEAVLAYGENSDEAQELAGEIEDLSRELSENRDTMQRAESAADELDHSLEEVDESSEDLSGTFDSLKVAAGNLLADGVRRLADGLGDLARETIETGQTFEDSMAKVQALSGATSEDLEKLKQTAIDQGAATVYSSSEAADALGYMALAGWDVNQMSSALPGVLNLAAASGMDLAEASDMVTDYLSAFNMTADQSAYFADLMAYAQSHANTTTEGLGEAFKNCAANMNAAGQDVETTTSLLSMMANQGLKGSEAGTALSAVMRDMTAKMKDGKIAIGDATVEVMDANGNYRDMTDILLDVESAVGGMGDAERASALQSTFTSDSIKGLNLMLNAGVGEAASFEDALRDSSGTAQETSDVMTNTLTGSMQDLEGNIETVQLALYDKLEPAMQGGIDVMNSFVDVIGWVVDNGETVVSVLAGMATGIAAYLAYTTLLTVMREGWMALEIVQKAAAAAQWLVNAAMEANPIGIVIGLIAGLVAMFITLWNTNEDFRNAVQPIWDAIQQAIGGVVDWFTGTALPAIQDFAQQTAQFFQDLWQRAQPIWEGILSVVRSAIDWFTGTALPAIQQFITMAAQFFQNLWTKIQPIWEGIRSAVSVVVDWFTGTALPAIQGFISAVVQFFQGLWNAVQPIWEAIRGVVEAVISFIVTYVSSYLQSLFTVWSTIFNAIWNVIQAVWPAIQTVVSTVINVVYTVVSTVINAISNVWNAVWSVIGSVVTTIWNGISTTVTTVLNVIRTIIDTVTNAIKGNWSAVWNTVWTTATNIWNGIRNTISTVINAVRTVVSSVVNGISSTVSGVFNNIWNTASNIWNGIRNTIGTAINGAKSTVSSVINGISSSVSSVFNGVKNTVTSVWNGIKSAIMTPINAAKDAVSSAINTISGIISGVKLQLPRIALPHFNVSGGSFPWGIGGEGSPPKFSVDWYARGGILTSPTIFGWNGDHLLGGGEAGHEAVLPIDTLQAYIDAAFQRNLGGERGLERIEAAIERLDMGLGRKIAENAPDSYPGDRSFRTALRRVGVVV